MKAVKMSGMIHIRLSTCLLCFIATVVTFRPTGRQLAARLQGRNISNAN